MNRNPIVPFVLIMVFGIVAMFLISFKGLGDFKELSKEKANGGEKTEEVAASTPEDVYKSSCLGCHGGQYEGGVGPALKGIGDKMSQEDIKKILVEGKGAMPGGLVKADQADAMAEWLAGLK